MLRINELHPALRRVDGCICGVNLGRTLQTHRLTGGWHFSHEGFRRLPVGRPWTVSTPLPRTLCWHKSVHQTTAELNDNARGKCIEAAAELSTPYTQTGASPDFFSRWPLQPPLQHPSMPSHAQLVSEASQRQKSAALGSDRHLQEDAWASGFDQVLRRVVP